MTEWNDQGANVVISNPYLEPVWATSPLGAQWISFVDSGVGGVEVETMWPEEYAGMAFYLTFFAPAPILSGQLRIWADDVAEVWVDDELSPRIGLPTTLVPDSHCIIAGSGGIGCEPQEFGTLNLAGLGAGSHKATIRARQLWGNTFGVMYEGSIEFVPEPATFGLAAVALAGIVLRLRLRRG